MANIDDSNIILIQELDNTKKLISMDNIIITSTDISLFNINKPSLNEDFYDTYLKVLYVHLVLLLNKSNNSKINIQNIDDLELFMIYLIFLAIFNLSNLKLITHEYLMNTKQLLKTKYDNFKIKNRILNLIIDKFITDEFNAINLNSLKQNLNLSEFLQDFDNYKEKPDETGNVARLPQPPSPPPPPQSSRPRSPSPPQSDSPPPSQSDSRPPSRPPSPSRSQSEPPPLEISSLPTGLSRPPPQSPSRPPSPSPSPLSSNDIRVTEWLFNNTIIVNANANEGNIQVPSNDRYIQTRYKKFDDKYYFNYEGATPQGVYVVQKPDNFDGDTNQKFGDIFSFIIDNEEIINLQEKNLKYVKFTFKDTETNNPPFEKPFFNLTLYYNDGDIEEYVIKNFYFSDFTENEVDVSGTIKTNKNKEIRDIFCKFFYHFNQLLKSKYPDADFDNSPCFQNIQQLYVGGGDVNYINLISINIINKLILGKQTEIDSFIIEFENFKNANIKGKDK